MGLPCSCNLPWALVGENILCSWVTLWSCTVQPLLCLPFHLLTWRCGDNCWQSELACNTGLSTAAGPSPCCLWATTWNNSRHRWIQIHFRVLAFFRQFGLYAQRYSTSRGKLQQLRGKGGIGGWRRLQHTSSLVSCAWLQPSLLLIYRILTDHIKAVNLKTW